MNAKYVKRIAESLRQQDVYCNVTNLMQRLIDLEEKEIIQFKTDYKASAEAAGWQIDTHDNGFLFLGKGTEIYNHEQEKVCQREDWHDVDEEFFFLDESDDFWRGLCNAANIDLIEKKIEEYWLISDQLAEKLRDDGEPVFVIDDLTVWGRMFTGKPIADDKAIQKIAKRIQAA